MIQLLPLKVQITDLTLPESLKYAIVGMCTVISILALLAVLITLISKGIVFAENRKKAAPLADLPEPAAAIAAQPPSPPQAPQVELIETDETTAALLIAIAAEQSGIPADHLLVKRIKLLGEHQ